MKKSTNFFSFKNNKKFAFEIINVASPLVLFKVFTILFVKNILSVITKRKITFLTKLVKGLTK